MKKILVVDDDLDVRQSLNDLFSRRYSVVLAADGSEGLAKVAGENPDLVISDFNMPEMTGLELLRALRAKEDTRPVVICASGISEDTVADLLRGGCLGFY